MHKLCVVVGVKYVASCSFGKDSTAMVLKLLEEKWPLDEVVFYDTGMEFQAVYSVRDRVVKILEEHSVQFTQLQPEKSFLWEMLAHPHWKRDGSYQYGYSWCGGCCRWQTTNKRTIINAHTEGCHIYIGIAVDEPERLKKLSENKSSPLAEWNMTERDCLEYCRGHGISWDEDGVDLYDILDRVSCWCCRNKNKKELFNIYKYLPDYWKKLKALQDRCPEPFKNYRNRQYGEYGNLYELEKVFKEEDSVKQMTIFDLKREDER